jgi:hypothetical protein
MAKRLLLLLGLVAVSPAAAEELQRLVASEGALSASQSSALDHGAVVAKVLDSPDASEVVSLGLVRVTATREAFLRCARDVECLRHNEDVAHTGRMEDLSGLSLDSRDLGYLRRCRPTDCDVRLGRDSIERFQHGIDWSDPGHPGKAAALFREELEQLAAGYRAGGLEALPAYEDNPAPTSVAGTLADLLQRRFFTLDLDPDLSRRLASSPGESPGDGDFLYWYQERFWRKTLTAVCHVSVLQSQRGDADLAFVLSRQIYASHYFDGAVELTLYLAPAGSNRGTLVFLSRARADVRPSGFTWLERLLINRLVRRRLEEQLRSMRDRLQSGPIPGDGRRTLAAPGSLAGSSRP